jgi:transcriptional regulator with XRE-family HTH domain
MTDSLLSVCPVVSVRSRAMPGMSSWDDLTPVERGHEVRRARTEQGLTKAAVARAAGVSTKTIARIEAGQHDQPHSLHPVLRHLRIGPYAPADTTPRPPPLDQATDDELLDEVRRRMGRAGSIGEHPDAQKNRRWPASRRRPQQPPDRGNALGDPQSKPGNAHGT